MGFTKDQLLARLKELQIDFSQYEHPTVSTVEAREKYVGDKGGGLCKILFLKCYLGGLVWEKEVQEWLLKKHWVRYFSFLWAVLLHLRFQMSQHSEH
eukprot:XP_024450307.1 uncharacterized protein LOC18096218 isoform X4 [Populus trichocarpa]